MRRIRLTAMEQAPLEQLFKTTEDRRRRARSQAVLMASRGRKRQIIAQDLGVHRTTVRLWLKHYQEHGLAGLQIHWAPGHPGRLPETLAPTIQAWVKDGPQSCGLDRANWTYEELATHLYRITGIEVKRTAMRVCCQRHAIRPYRPPYRYLRGDPQKPQAAQAALVTFKNSASGGVRAAQPRRSTVSPRADVVYHPGVAGTSAAGGDAGYQGAGLLLSGAPSGARAADAPLTRATYTEHRKAGAEPTAAAANGLCGASWRYGAYGSGAPLSREGVITIDHAPGHRGAGVEHV